MEDINKVLQARSKKHVASVCRFCGKAVTADDGVYVKTKRKDDIFYHIKCMKKGAVRFTEVR